MAQLTQIWRKIKALSVLWRPQKSMARWTTLQRGCVDMARIQLEGLDKLLVFLNLVEYLY